MINLILSLAIAGVVYVGSYYWLESWYQALPPALLIGGIAYYFLARRIGKKLEEIIKDAYKILEKLKHRKDLTLNKARRNAIIDEAIEKLKEGYKLAPWQFFVRSQIDAHIGILLYRDKQDLNEAIKYLERAFQRHWVALAMLAVAYMKKHKPEKMEETFELAVRLNKKEDLLWNLYAYCLNKIKKRDKAIEVLSRARKILPENQRLIDNLVALQNNKKMKMRDYNELWYQFHLEKPPQQRQRVKYIRK